MEGMITVRARRSFFDSFLMVVRLWFAAPASLLSWLAPLLVMTWAFYDKNNLWFALLGATAYIAILMPFMWLLQAVILTRSARSVGQPVYTFDGTGGQVETGAVVTRAPWSGVQRILVTRRWIFIYITKRAAWVFRHSETTHADETAILALAAQANVKINGTLSR